MLKTKKICPTAQKVKQKSCVFGRFGFKILETAPNLDLENIFLKKNIF